MRTQLKKPVQPFDAEKVSADLQHEIEQFYYREATLLDRRHFDEWLSMLDEDLRYFMPLRRNRMNRFESTEFSSDNDFASFDDSYKMIKGRIRKLKTDVSWSENPASKTRHVISNIIITPCQTSDTYEVDTAFITYRNRAERQVDIWTGERRDIIKRADSVFGFKISRRTIILDQSTILSNNMSIFF